MMVRRTQCFISNFLDIGPPVPERKIFEGFYQIWAWRPSESYDQPHINILYFLLPQSLDKILVINGQVISEKSKFLFSYINGLEPRSRNDLVLQYSHTFINSISCLYLPTFRSLMVTVTENSHCFHFFPIE